MNVEAWWYPPFKTVCHVEQKTPVTESKVGEFCYLLYAVHTACFHPLCNGVYIIAWISTVLPHPWQNHKIGLLWTLVPRHCAMVFIAWISTVLPNLWQNHTIGLLCTLVPRHWFHVYNTLVSIILGQILWTKIYFFSIFYDGKSYFI